MKHTLVPSPTTLRLRLRLHVFVRSVARVF